MTGSTWPHVLAPPAPALLDGPTAKPGPPAPFCTGTLPVEPLLLLPPPEPRRLAGSTGEPPAEHPANASDRSVRGKARTQREREDKAKVSRVKRKQLQLTLTPS